MRSCHKNKHVRKENKMKRNVKKNVFLLLFFRTFELHGSMSTTRSSRGFMGSGKPCSKRHSLPSASVTGSYVDAVNSSSKRKRLFDKATLLVQDIGIGLLGIVRYLCGFAHLTLYSETGQGLYSLCAVSPTDKTRGRHMIVNFVFAAAATAAAKPDAWTRGE